MRSSKPTARATARIVARRGGIVAGLTLGSLAFSLLDDRVVVDARIDDGDRVEPGAVVAEIAARARAILTGERTALNLLGRLSGIATATRTLVDLVAANARKHRGYAQDDAGSTCAREIRGCVRRRHQSPLRFGRRRADQRQSSQRSPVRSMQPSRRRAPPSVTWSRSKSRSTRSSSCAKRSTSRSTRSCSTT